MKLYGLTGGIGMGKSASDKFLRERGFAIIDTDVIARQLVEPGQPGLTDIRQAFGPSILDADGRLRRGELGKLVFGNELARRKLEDILHPKIRVVWQKHVEVWRAENKSLAVVVIPLLYETGVEGQFDSVICVACTGATQRKRLHSRGLNDGQIEGRIKAQMPIEKKMNLSNYVVWTEGDMPSHESQLFKIIR